MTGSVRWGRVLGVGLAVTGTATACSTGGLPESATTQGDTVIQIWHLFLWGAVAVAALIWVLVGYAVISSVRRARAAPEDDIPRQSQYRTRLEIVYTAIPLVVVAGLFAVTIWGNQTLTSTSTPPDLQVEVIGFQWQWQFHYQDADVRVNGAPNVLPTLMLPVGRTIRFHVVADDVIHSFWVPQFLEKRDLIPGVDTNNIQVFVKEPGEWTGRCAEFCGLDHWQMKFNVKAVPADEFDRWLADARTRRQPIIEGSLSTEVGTSSTSTTLTPTTLSTSTVVGR